MVLYKRWQFVAVVIPLLLVEAASFYKLFGALRWSFPTWLALTTAGAFLALMLGAIVAMGLDLPTQFRTRVYIGGLALFAFQGLANSIGSFEFANTAMPKELVARFFGISPDQALWWTAVISGSILSCVSISFWSLLSKMLERQWAEEKNRRRSLADLDQLLEKGASR